MKTILRKLTSRKFLVSIVSVICGILGMCGVANSTVTQIGSVLMILLPSLTYVLTEGALDKASLIKAAKDIIEIVDTKEEEK